MTWIDTISPAAAKGKLKSAYERIAGKSGQVDNILIAHSLRPHTLDGHMALYKSVLHHFGNTTEAWILETVGVAVSLLNGCGYCVEHHFAGLKRLLKDDERAAEIRAALESGAPDRALDGKALAAVLYAARLTRTPRDIRAHDIEALRSAGFEDGEILEINQVAAYFAYANRTILGLGVSLDGEELGHHPDAS